MNDQLVAQVERALGQRVRGWRPVTGGGWSIARRGIFELDDGATAFAKTGDVPDTMAAIRTECAIYPIVEGAFVPRLLAADPDLPLLVIEDLSSAIWPPPWTSERLALLDELFTELAATVADPRLPALTERIQQLGGWEVVAADPTALLASGAADAVWLRGALPVLLEAQARASTEGDRLLHLDVRSDNLCFRDGRALLVDWNHAVRGDPRWDRLLMLHTVQMEGGPPVELLAPDPDPGIIAWLAGFFACRVGLPPPQGAPAVRKFQRAQLDVVLPWACRLLDLPQPGDARP